MAKKVKKKRQPQARASAKSKEKPKSKKKAPAKSTPRKIATAKKAGQGTATRKKKATRATKATSQRAHTAKKTSPRKTTAAKVPVKSAAPAPAKSQVESSNTPLADAQLRRAKSNLSPADRQQYRRRLMAKRVEILGDVAALKSDVRTDSGDHFSPEHMADVGSINYEQEFTLGLMESEQRMLQEIDEAIMRIDARIYGVCIETGKPIGKPRLDAKPWAKYCIEVAREKERTGKL